MATGPLKVTFSLPFTKIPQTTSDLQAVTKQTQQVKARYLPANSDWPL